MFGITICGLIYTLPIRGDVRKMVTYLCSRLKVPTVEDEAKLIQVLRYLKAYPDLGPTYSAFKHGDGSSGLILTASTDAAHAVHTDGASQSAHTISVGYNNSPFYTYCHAERQCIVADAMSAEYIALGRCAQNVLYFRQFARDLGYPQDSPTEIYSDNLSSINLTKAPVISRKSRYIFLQHHFIRSLNEQKHIAPVQKGTHDDEIVVPDMLSKGTGKYYYALNQLFPPQTPPIIPVGAILTLTLYPYIVL